MFCLSNCVPMQSRYVPTYRHLRRDAVGGASPRSFGGIGRRVTCYVG